MTDTHVDIQTMRSICFVWILLGPQKLEDTQGDGRTTNSHLLDLFCEIIRENKT